MKKSLRLVSWNVNGVRAVMKKDFTDSVRRLDADILAIQETKIQDDQIDESIRNIDGYRSWWSCATVKKGYSGVSVYSRLEPKTVNFDIGNPAFDNEGRVIEMEFDDFTFFNVYFPNGQMSDERLRYKLDFYQHFFDYADQLRREGKSLIITGDYNTAHNEIDLKNPKSNEKRSGFLRIERDWIDKIISDGYVDTFRHFYPDTVKYSWWTYRFQARQKNAGWRIDYFFATRDLIEGKIVKDAFIDNSIYGSDHCPVGIEIQF